VKTTQKGMTLGNHSAGGVKVDWISLAMTIFEMTHENILGKALGNFGYP
jgi:hypothetical protein